MYSLNEARKRFSKDLYATRLTGVEILDIKEHYSKCSLEIKEEHLNANNVVMGGAIYTLADLTFAAAANTDGDVVSLSGNIEYLRPAVTKILTAEAFCVKHGKTVCFYDVMITDENEKPVAKVTFMGSRKREAEGVVK